MNRRAVLIRVFVCFGAVLSAAVLGSCSTMMAYEDARKQKVAEQAKASPSPKPTAGTGSLLQPIIPVDHEAEERQRIQENLAAAETAVQANAPSRLTNVAPGPVVPLLRTAINNPADLETTRRAYELYAEAVYAVEVSLRAYGLIRNLTPMEQVRRVSEWWDEYFSLMQVQPSEQFPTEKELAAFFASLKKSEEKAGSSIATMNSVIDAQRTRAYQP